MFFKRAAYALPDRDTRQGGPDGTIFREAERPQPFDRGAAADAVTVDGPPRRDHLRRTRVALKPLLIVLRSQTAIYRGKRATPSDNGGVGCYRRAAGGQRGSGGREQGS